MMPRNTLNGNAPYKVDSGTADDLVPDSGLTLSGKLSDIPGAEDFQPGDEVTLTIKAKVGEPDENGVSDFDVVRVQVEPMDHGTKTQRSRDTKVNPEGTLL